MDDRRLRVLKIVFLPLVLLFLDSGWLAVFAAAGWPAFYLAPLIALDVFFAVDILVRKTSRQRDRFKRPAVVLAFLAFPLVAAAPALERWASDRLGIIGFSPPVYAIGLVLEAAGGLCLFLGRRRLGKWGTTSVALEEGHVLVTGGLYRYTRNPIYLGMIVLVFGFALSLTSFLSALVAGTAVLLFCLLRIKAEEKILSGKFGKTYTEYVEAK